MAFKPVGIDENSLFPPRVETRLSTTFARPYPAKTLLPFYAALADRDSNPCDILICGDSITEGEGATAVTNRWIDKFAQRMRLAFPVQGVAGGAGYIPPWYAFTLTGQAFTAAGYTAVDTTKGLGRRAITLGKNATDGAGSLTITRKCTGFTVYSARAYTGFDVIVDGGAPISSAQGSGLSVQGTAVTGLTSGTHTIQIVKTGADGSSIPVQGVMFYDGDETKGIRVWDGSKSGTRAEQFAAASGAAGSDAWADMLNVAVTPDLVVMAWLTNDYTTKTAAEYKANVQNFITLVRSKVSAVPIALMPPYERDTTSGVEPWARYIEALAELAATNTNTALIDLGERIPKLSPDPVGLLVDGTHPNDKGYSLIADMVTGVIRPH
jgi:lysophospholipase L1-like esterase